MLERQKYEFLRSELKKARLNAGLLQTDIAKSLKKPQSYVSKIESGGRSIVVVKYISYYLALGLDPVKWHKNYKERLSKATQSHSQISPYCYEK